MTVAPALRDGNDGRARGRRQRGGIVGAGIVEHIDRRIRQDSPEIFDGLRDRQSLVIAGDQDCDHVLFAGQGGCLPHKIRFVGVVVLNIVSAHPVSFLSADLCH